MLPSLLVYGLINSVTLAITALGFSLTYGISRVANFAHGALYVLAGFRLVLSQPSPTELLPRFPLGHMLTSLIGAAIYRLALIRVRECRCWKSSSLSLWAAPRWSFAIFWLSRLHYSLPPMIRGSVNLLGVPVDLQRVALVVVGALLVLFLWLSATPGSVSPFAPWRRMSRRR
jgi:branched-chain amino acid transport system permease protein